MLTRSRTVFGLFACTLMVGFVLWLARPATSTQQTSGRLQVVAAENFWGDIAQQLGGSYVHVASIISDPSADPHLYESNAINAAAVGSADITIVNGLGYDDFMTKLLDGSPGGGRTVVSAAAIVQAAANDNPHLWYSYGNVKRVAVGITASYIIRDPTHRSVYLANATALGKTLTELDQRVAAIKQQFTGTAVAYSEPIADYLLRAAGLTVQTPTGFAKAIESGDEPNPADTAAMENLIQNHVIRVYVDNPQATSPVTERIKQEAVAAGIPVVTMSETIPKGARDYQAWQQAQLDQLAAALAR